MSQIAWALRSAARASVRVAPPRAARATLIRQPVQLASTRFFSAGKPVNAEPGKAPQSPEEAPMGAETENTADKSAATGAAAEAAQQKSEVEALQEKYEAKDKEVAKFKDAYARSVADFRNLQKTTEQDIKNARDYALQKFARDLLDSVDNFDRALAAAKPEALEQNQDLKTFYDGVTMVQSVLEKTLAKHGLVKVDPMGEKFDPKEHEATFQTPQPGKEPGTIFHVQQIGFKYNDRVLRAPKVGVVAGEN